MVTTDDLEKEHGWLGRVLSRNDQYHHYAETGDEFFVNSIVEYDAKLRSGTVDPEAHYIATWKAARFKNTGYGEIFACTKFLDVLLKALPMRWYFTHTKIYQPFWVQKNLIGKTTGVSNYN